MSHLCRVQPPKSCLAPQFTLRLRQLGGIVAIRKQVPVGIERHGDRGMPEPLLHHLGREPQAAVHLAVDAP